MYSFTALFSITKMYLLGSKVNIVVVASGRVDIDLENEPLGYSSDDKPVFLADIWPKREEIREAENRFVVPAIFRQVRSGVIWCDPV